MKRMMWIWIVLLLVACGGGAAGTQAETAVVAEPSATPALPTATSESDDAPLPDEPASPTVEPTTTSTPSEEAQPREIELIGSFTEPSQTNGEVLILIGQIFDTAGNPLPNSSVEIWQTDVGGVYDHPDDPGTTGRDTTFQFYGTAVADSTGWYVFRTIVPGKYEPRPRHIHFKVKQNGETLLTSQFYFSEDVAEVEQEGIFRAAGESGDALLLQLVRQDERLLAVGNVYINTGSGGEFSPTPAQVEGPFYPVVTLADYDNDLTILP